MRKQLTRMDGEEPTSGPGLAGYHIPRSASQRASQDSAARTHSDPNIGKLYRGFQGVAIDLFFFMAGRSISLRQRSDSFESRVGDTGCSA
jgi:hypothetical protein